MQRPDYLGLCAFLKFFLTNREDAKSAKEEKEEEYSLKLLFLLFFFLSFVSSRFVFFESFLTNRESAKSVKEEEEEGLRFENYAFDAFFEDGNVEVYEKIQAVFNHFKIGDNLGFADGS